MTIFLALGTLLVLSVIAGLPEIIETCEAMWMSWTTVIEPETDDQFWFVDSIELYGDFWFQKDEFIPRRVWRQKNAKCAWAPEPPMNRLMCA